MMVLVDEPLVFEVFVCVEGVFDGDVFAVFVFVALLSILVGFLCLTWPSKKREFAIFCFDGDDLCFFAGGPDSCVVTPIGVVPKSISMSLSSSSLLSMLSPDASIFSRFLFLFVGVEEDEILVLDILPSD